MTTKIMIGDVREQLALLEPDSIDCVVTSPPYWGLRDYGVDGQIGLERTLGEHLEVIVEVFEGVRRAMKPTATLWLNYGDCYATSPNGRSAAATKAAGKDDRTFRDKPFSTIGGVLKPKDLCMIPNRLAIALQEAGWWVRSEIIWHKPNPMPESIKDRPGSSHEKVWLLSKSPRYFYDHEAVAEGLTESSVARLSQDIETQEGSYRQPGKTNGPMKAVGSLHMRETSRKDGDRWRLHEGGVAKRGTRNLRNVWTIATAAFSEAHFATFPPALAERCIKAGCPEGGTVLDPFFGAGTTGLVAARLQRNCIGIELNPEYAAIARKCIISDAPLFANDNTAPAQAGAA